MAVRFIILVAVACVMFSVAPNASRAESDQQELKLVTPPLSIFREQIRPSADALLVPTGFSREQILHGDRVFHGEAANGQCSVCHGKDGKGTPNGNDLTAGMFVWSDGSVKELCVPKTLSVLMTPRNHRSWRNDRATVFRRGGLGLSIQVEDPA